jgi:hypothetical protein
MVAPGRSTSRDSRSGGPCYLPKIARQDAPPLAPASLNVGALSTSPLYQLAESRCSPSRRW